MGRNHFWFTVAPIEQIEPGTDLWAMERGYISITPLSLDLTDLPGLNALAAAHAARCAAHRRTDRTGGRGRRDRAEAPRPAQGLRGASGLSRSTPAPASSNPASANSERVPVQAKAFGSRCPGFRFTG